MKYSFLKTLKVCSTGICADKNMRRQNIDIYVTGSNSKFLSSDVITEFRGRKDEVHIMHLHSPNTFPTMTHLFQRPGTNTAFMAECLIF